MSWFNKGFNNGAVMMYGCIPTKYEEKEDDWDAPTMEPYEFMKLQTLSIKYKLKIVHLRDLTIKPEVLNLIQKETAEKWEVLPIELDLKNEVLTIATTKPGRNELFELHFRQTIATRFKLHFVLMSKRDLQDALEEVYSPVPALELEDGSRDHILYPVKILTLEQERNYKVNRRALYKLFYKHRGRLGVEMLKAYESRLVVHNNIYNQVLGSPLAIIGLFGFNISSVTIELEEPKKMYWRNLYIDILQNKNS